MEVLGFFPDEKGSRKGFFDIAINEKKIRRNLALFSQENGKRWIGFGSCMRDGKWVSIYEDEPAVIFEFTTKCLKALDEYFIRN